MNCKTIKLEKVAQTSHQIIKVPCPHTHRPPLLIADSDYRIPDVYQSPLPAHFITATPNIVSIVVACTCSAIVHQLIIQY